MRREMNKIKMGSKVLIFSVCHQKMAVNAYIAEGGFPEMELSLYVLHTHA